LVLLPVGSSTSRDFTAVVDLAHDRAMPKSTVARCLSRARRLADPLSRPAAEQA